MLHKFLNVHKLKPFSKRVPAPAKHALAQPEDSGNSILKVVHAGGNVERYYMAIPAAKILEKYPSFLLARPEVFTRPWDSVVKPDVILTPGEKVFLVPRRTVWKLRRKIRRPNKDFSINSFMSQSSVDVSTETLAQRRHIGSAVVYASESDTSICNSTSRKKSDGKNHATFCGIKKHVTFAGLDVKHKLEKTHSEIEQDSSESSSSLQSQRRRRRVRIVTWQPTLIAITETHGNDLMKY
ncbi:hypothetical protein M0R45_032695 [Rubus argutus]|uniref:Uncharacterized protein n=1 Tax=Rubus argutus TaxID=59490 RepID=A0AAW1WLV9_RUBAR